jgi:ABC-type glycerol-3-phosphate transport system permease component
MTMRKKWNIPRQAFTYLVLLLIIVIAVFPAVWMLSTSVKPVTELYNIPPEIIPAHPTLQNYVNVIASGKMTQAFVNSCIVTGAVVCLTLFFSVMAGYGLARYRFRGSKVMKTALLFGQMIPGVVIIIPLYFVFTKIGMLDTHWSLIIADMALTIPMGVIMLSSFFAGVPKELEEAAKIDGCTGFSALFRVVLPIAKPGMISVAIYTFIHAWEEFLFALNLSMSTKTRTLPIAVNTFAGEFAVDWGATMAAAAIVALPVLALFLLCNRYFVKGLSDGAVKG